VKAVAEAMAPRAGGVARVTNAPATAGRFRRLTRSGLAWGVLVSVVFALWVLFGLGGSTYYTTPLAVRGYADGHALLKPSGPAGQSFGVVGAILLLVPFFYMARKRVRRLKAAGSASAWLEIHLFCGIVGPVLITFHTSFKFNGIVSAAYWSMVLVMASGFVGRYLYVRIPHSLRGHELTRNELDAQAVDLNDALVELAGSDRILEKVATFERTALPAADRLSWRDLLFGELALKRHLRVLDRELQHAGLDESFRRPLVALSRERSLLLRRTAYLLRTRTLFNLWHVFHLPLVYLLLVIAAAHVAVVLYLGYVPFRW
jgi:hypothetical protein